MQRFYGESEERITPIASVMLDALEKDEYWFVLKRIDESRDEDVGRSLPRSRSSAYSRSR